MLPCGPPTIETLLTFSVAVFELRLLCDRDRRKTTKNSYRIEGLDLGGLFHSTLGRAYYSLSFSLWGHPAQDWHWFANPASAPGETNSSCHTPLSVRKKRWRADRQKGFCNKPIQHKSTTLNCEKIPRKRTH